VEVVNMKKILFLAAALALGFALTASAAETLKGSISDKMCGADHKGEDAVKCTLGCVQHGSPFVFVVSKDKVLDIQNQKDAKINADLTKYAGKDVTVTGTLSKDGKAVTIDTIQAQ
jgi:hypothetical protein